MSVFLSALLGVVVQQSVTPLDPTFPKGKRMSTHGSVNLAPDARWIWAAQTDKEQSVILTRTFDVKAPVKDARLFVTVDNFYRLNLDGNLLSQTRAGVDDEDSWHNAREFEITGALKPGRHVLEVTAYNVSGPAGLLARLEINHKPFLFSDASWTAEDRLHGIKAQPATVIAKAGGGAWAQNVSNWPVAFEGPPAYLSHLMLTPVRIAPVDEKSDPDHLSWIDSKDLLALRSSDAGKPWKVLIDFGKELTGRVTLGSEEALAVSVGTGESAGEALEKPYTHTSLNVSGKKEGSTPYSAFRFASLEFPGSEASANLRVRCDHLYYPTEYKGSFDCSDPLLTKIWYTGAYTAHLCMQQDIWDAPKRDRLRWMGDLHVSGEVINNVFGDTFLMEQTLRRLRDDAQGGKLPSELPASHVNGIPGYSCAWLSGMSDFYNHTGDISFVRSEADSIKSLMEYFRGELDADDTFQNKRGQWPFVDWAPEFNKDTPMARAATHLFLVKALYDGAYLLDEIGDHASAAKYRAWSDHLKAVAQVHLSQNGTYGDRRQENAMAIISGVATPAQTQSIYEKVLNPHSDSWQIVATPYYNNYVIFALTQSGHHQEAMNFIRSYWGGMIGEGATSFWEGYDLSWDKHNAHIHLQADDGTGYFVSLCHGWSAGATNWLTEEVLGVRSTGAGFRTVDINPQLGNLTWASGKVPTRRGTLSEHVERTGSGYEIRLDIPAGVSKAHLFMHDVGLRLKGGARSSQSLDLGPGRYIIEATGQ